MLNKSTDKMTRRGATLVETAIILTLAMTMIVGSLELVVFMNRYQAASNAVRRVAREATVRGKDAGPEKNPWGPTELTVNAGGTHEVAVLAKKWLMMVRPEDVTVRLRWLDGDNDWSDRVQVDLTYPYTSTTMLFGKNYSFTKTVTSVMEISH